ncbi:thiamine pyrophosphate-binding protein [Paraburkholderia sediminicola]|uniref:thiamine pyrophosphate-dependent enzyme n=1 Tax=Paraburkholderia sediminicola TaxID=458836 RepID=UPI0038BC8C7F
MQTVLRERESIDGGIADMPAIQLMLHGNQNNNGLVDSPFAHFYLRLMNPATATTSSHALLSVLAANGIDRVFLVPGESYLGILDALADFPQIDVVTCRHEAGAGFMACADGRLTRRPGVVMVSRGPGASNASIALHTAQQDGIPLLLIVGQIPKADLRKEAFQEIDYRSMVGSIAKWVVEVTEPEQLAAAAFKALRIATADTPGAVVLVVPEDIQQQQVVSDVWRVPPSVSTVPSDVTLERIARLLEQAQRPLIIAGGAFEAPRGRESLLRLVQTYDVPVAVSFRRQDIFPNQHPLYAGDLGLANPAEQIEAFESSDFVLALGTRLGDITTQGYRFPKPPRAAQTFVHCHADGHAVGLHVAPDIGVVCDPVALADALVGVHRSQARSRQWTTRLRGIATRIAEWPARTIEPGDGVRFVDVVRSLADHAPADAVICVDAGTFAAPVYRHFPFRYPRRLMSPLSGAMGYGTPAAIATQLRLPAQKTICLVGDGGFAMTGNEMIASVARRLPILFILSNNNCYGSIRVHQDRTYPGRHIGTTLTNPDFTLIAGAFGIEAERVTASDEIDAAVKRGLAARRPYFIEVMSSIESVQPLSSVPSMALNQEP